jgi:hypothetical protein
MLTTKAAWEVYYIKTRLTTPFLLITLMVYLLWNFYLKDHIPEEWLPFIFLPLHAFHFDMCLIVPLV